MYTLEILLDQSIPENIVEYYRQLQEKDSTDSGIDLAVVDDINIVPFGLGTIDFKIKCQMKNVNEETVAYSLEPRSSISKTPLIMANSRGIIDKDYRGNIMAKVRNIPLPDNNVDYSVDSGKRLFQILSPDLSPLKLRIVHELTETSRGEGGFGSTGVEI